MDRILTCISIEKKKFFSSKLPLLTIFALTFIPFVGGFFIFILKNPNLAKELGFISTKAQILGTADWTSYLSLLSQAISIGGLLVFGFIMSWIFGREYSDRTIKDLLTLPISRSIIVLSKFIVASLWCLMLSIYVLILGLFIGKIIDIPGKSTEAIVQGIFIFFISSYLLYFCLHQ